MIINCKKIYRKPIAVTAVGLLFERKICVKLNESFASHEMDGQAVVVPMRGAEFHGLVQGNKTLAAIVECLQEDTTEEGITDALCERFDGDREVIRADVAHAVAMLREIGAIDD